MEPVRSEVVISHNELIDSPYIHVHLQDDELRVLELIPPDIREGSPQLAQGMAVLLARLVKAHLGRRRNLMEHRSLNRHNLVELAQAWLNLISGCASVCVSVQAVIDEVRGMS